MKIANTTTFHQSDSDEKWYWSTDAGNNLGVADGSQGYASVADAMNGYFSSQGYPDWKPGRVIPEGYSGMVTVGKDYKIHKYSNDEEGE